MEYLCDPYLRRMRVTKLPHWLYGPSITLFDIRLTIE